MASFTIAYSNSVGLIGPGAATNWGVMVWGVDPWGFSSDITVNVLKAIANNIFPSGAVLGFGVNKSVANDLATTCDPSAEYLSDPAGYQYVFPRPSTNAENRPLSSFTCGIAAGGAWTSGTAGSTVWS